MSESIFDLAYEKAIAHYRECVLGVFRDINAENPTEDFDLLHRASSRALELHFNSLKLAEKVWAKSISYEKAEKSLAAQFPEFSAEVVGRALGAAYVKAR